MMLSRFTSINTEQNTARQKEGIAIAKAEGKYKGRKPIAVDGNKFTVVYNRWKAGEITARASMKELGVKPSTFYRRIKAYENEMNTCRKLLD